MVILCGGLGKRLRSIVKGLPKPMAEVKRRPFLDILIGYLYQSGFRRFILNTGYRGNQIKRYYLRKKVWKVKFSQEKKLLGTGGSIKKSARFISSNPFLVLNGDSFCKVSFKKFLKFHRKKNAIISVVLSKKEKNQAYAAVEIDRAKRIIFFHEKKDLKNTRFISAGIYLFDKKALSFLPKKKAFSLEYDLFPTLEGKKFYGFLTDDRLIDIGTPKGLAQARKNLRKDFKDV